MYRVKIYGASNRCDRLVFLYPFLLYNKDGFKIRVFLSNYCGICCNLRVITLKVLNSSKVSFLFVLLESIEILEYRAKSFIMNGLI